MPAPRALREGFYQPSSRAATNADILTRRYDDEEELPTPLPISYTRATEVTVLPDRCDAVAVPVVRKALPVTRKTRIDFVPGLNDDDSFSWLTAFRGALHEVFGSTSRFHLMLNLTLTDAKARIGSYVLSFCSVCTVVCVCVVMMTILSSFAIVSLRMAEDSYGPVDLQLRTGGFPSGATSLNYTRVAEVLEALPAAQQMHSYRILLDGKARKQSSCVLPGGHVNGLWYSPAGNGTTTVPAGCPPASSTATPCVLCQETCVSQYCSDSVEDVTLVVLDPSSDPATLAVTSGQRVAKIMGSLPQGSVIISNSLGTALEVNVGDPLLVNAAMDSAVRHVFHQIPDYEAVNPHLLLSLRVGAFADDAFFPDSHDDFFILIPPRHFTSLVVDAMAPSVAEDARAAARTAKPAEYATRIVFQMPSALRKRAYMEADYISIRAQVRDWGAPITTKLGANQITMETPLLTVLSQLRFFSSFVRLIISNVVLALSFLSVILIYTLLSIGVETKTYELGIQRMVGFTRLHLAMLVFTNTYSFTIPAWLLGLVMGQLGYWIVRAVIVHFTAVPLGLGVSAAAVGWATLAGLGVPLIAALLPIRSLISMALPDALDTSRGRGTGVVYRIQRGRSRETDAIFLGVGFLCALGGFSMYSFFPNSLITLNFPLMFYILFVVLLGMLGGLVMLATNFERVMETVMRYLFMFWEAPSVFSMVEKSLSAHRRRNQQTTIMYALSVGFVVFASVAFKIQVETIKYSNERSRGADVTLYLRRAQRPSLGITPLFAQNVTNAARGTSAKGTAGYVYESTPLNPDNLLGMVNDGRALFFADYIELEQDLMAALGEKVVAGITYRMERPPSSNLWPVQQINMRTFGRTESMAASLCPVPPNFFDVVSSKFVKVNKYDTDVGRYGLTGALYTANSTNKAVIATTTNRVFALDDFSSAFMWETRVAAFSRGVHNANDTLRAPRTQVLHSAGRAVAVMDSSPVVLMTKFPNNMGEVLISVPAAVRHTGVPYLSCRAMPVGTAFVRVPSEADYAEVKTFLRRWLSERRLPYAVRDLRSTTDDIRTVDTIFTVFFVVTQVMIMLICFFSLMSSMSANVLDSAKEIGVLLCMGMPQRQVLRVYVWEAFILVISSGCLGLVVGMALAETMLLQSALFTQLFVPFPFPFMQLCIVVLVGLGSALAASVSPVMYLLRLPSITHILRRVI